MVKKNVAPSVISLEQIRESIVLLRGSRVILDSVLARMYGVQTGELVRAVKRNQRRFPEDFMFQLNGREWGNLKSTNANASSLWGGRRYAPYAFTEQGVAMMSLVLNQPQAIQVNIEIMRVFVHLREVLASDSGELAYRLTELEQRLNQHDQDIADIFCAIRELISKSEPRHRPIGFVKTDE